MDDHEREKFYSSTPDDADDADYELEPPDPAILATEQRRAQEALETLRMSIDIDEIYREVERDRGREIVESWFGNSQFRFRVKHLLVVTAVLAILLTLARLNLMIVVVVGVMLTIAGLFLYFQWQDKKQQDEANRRRQELYARRRAQLDKAASSGADAETMGKLSEPLPPLPSEVDEAWQKAARESGEFRFQFSLKQFMIAMTAAAVIFGLVHVLGGPTNAATLLGLVALFGLIVHALGFEPAQVIILGWWLILVMYVLLSIVGAMVHGSAT